MEKEKRRRRSFATREDVIASAFDDPAAVHLDTGGALVVVVHEGTLEMIDGVARTNGMTRGDILWCVLMGEEVQPSRPVYVLSVHAEDPRALARDNPLTIASDDPRDPPVAFIATQDPTPAERQALKGHSVLVRLVGAAAAKGTTKKEAWSLRH